MEIWKNIEDYEGIYQVSNKGRVKKIYKNGKEKILKQFKYKKGYLYVTLSKLGKRKSVLIHRLVAKAFIPNTNNLPQVNHKDEDKTNNYVNNLEWCTNEYNNRYGTRDERATAWCLKPVVCIETGIIYKSTGDAERQLNIYTGGVRKVCSGKNKSAHNLHFKYVNED